MFHLINLTNLIHSVPSLAQHHARTPLDTHAPLFHSPKRDKHNSPASKSREKRGKESKGKQDKNDDNDNSNGGFLEPIIEDLQGFIKGRRNPVANI